MHETDAFERALGLLRHRDLSAHEVRRRLEERGVPSSEADDVLDRLARTGLVDDGRYARQRASALATRGAGNALIRYDLEHAGVGGEEVDGAIEALEPESVRVREIVHRRGSGAATARYLRSKGFDGEAIAALVADESADELG